MVMFGVGGSGMTAPLRSVKAMPRFGLAAATAHVPIGKRGETAWARLAGAAGTLQT